MTRRLLVGTLALVLAATAAWAGTTDRWLHVRVEEDQGDEAQISVNIPLELVAQLLPLIQVDALRGGRIRIDDPDWPEIDLRAVLAELQTAPDGEYVTVRSRDENVRVAKERGYLLVNVDENDGEKIRVRLPLRVVDALLSAGHDELDLLAALEALGDETEGDIITMEDRHTRVRVWIDDDQDGR